MSRTRFRQNDLARALKAVRSTGIGVARIEISENGKIIIVPGDAAMDDEALSADDPWLEKARRELGHGVE